MAELADAQDLGLVGKTRGAAAAQLGSASAQVRRMAARTTAARTAISFAGFTRESANVRGTKKSSTGSQMSNYPTICLEPREPNEQS